MKFPGAEALAFNCAVPSGVPYTMSAGVLQVITGVALVIVSVVVFVCGR
jgi:hypothetical protein